MERAWKIKVFVPWFLWYGHWGVSTHLLGTRKKSKRTGRCREFHLISYMRGAGAKIWQYPVLPVCAAAAGEREITD